MICKLNSPRVILTTNEYACGHNFYERCFVVMTERPDIVGLQQMIGRSNRVNYQGEKNGAIVLGYMTYKDQLIKRLKTEWLEKSLKGNKVKKV